jgi:hypothetical protein
MMENIIIEDFFQTYPSNTVRADYVGVNSTNQPSEPNTPSSFKVHVNPPLHFDTPDQWEVGLSEVFLPGQYMNIYPPFSDTDIMQLRAMPDFQPEEKIGDLTAMETTKSVANVRLDVGLYDEESLTKTLNNIVVKAIKKSTKRPTAPSERARVDEMLNRFYFLKYKAESQRIRMVIPPRTFVMCYNARIQKLLGWSRFDREMSDKVAFIKEANLHLDKDPSRSNSTILANSGRRHPVGVLLPETCDVTRDNKTVFVYCNLVKDNLVGNVRAPLLRMVDLGLSARENAYPQVHRSYLLPQYHRIRQARFETVEFNLTNTLGENFPFRSGTCTTLVVHFRRISRRTDAAEVLRDRTM